MKKQAILSFFMANILLACAAGVKTTTNKEAKTYEFGTPEGFSVTSLNATHVVVSYNYNGAVDGGYKIYFGDSTELNGFASKPGTEDDSPYPTLANSITIGGLPEGAKAYFAATALKADGTESAKTAILEITPVAPAAGEKQHTVDVEIEACIDKLDKLTFKEGKVFLSEHELDSSFPGKAKDCDIDGIRIRTFEFRQTADEIDRVIPALASAPWAPENLEDELDLTIYKIVTTKPMLITNFETISKNCTGGISFNNVEATVENDAAGVPNTVVMDATSCDTDKGINFINGDRGLIKFKMTYTAADAE